MCGGGCGGTPTEPGVVADPEGPPDAEQWYVVSYLDGTTEEVQGLDEARGRLLNIDSRAEGTDRLFLGGSYARKR